MCRLVDMGCRWVDKNVANHQIGPVVVQMVEIGQLAKEVGSLVAYLVHAVAGDLGRMWPA